MLEFEEQILTKAIAEVIKEHRQKLGWNRDELARRLNVHKNTMYYIEDGVKRGDYPHRRQLVSLKNFIKVASLMGLDSGEMLNQVIVKAKELDN